MFDSSNPVIFSERSQTSLDMFFGEQNAKSNCPTTAPECNRPEW